MVLRLSKVFIATLLALGLMVLPILTILLMPVVFIYWVFTGDNLLDSKKFLNVLDGILRLSYWVED